MKCVSGVIYIFMFFNAKEEKTRYKYLLYYTFCLVENTAIITIWFLSPTTKLGAWYVFPAMVGHYLAFILGIMFMVVYYIWMHPTGGIEIPWPISGNRRTVKAETKAGSRGEDKEDKEMVEMKVVLLRENRVVSDLKGSAESRSELGTLDRFLNENSDKVAVRRFSSLPPGAVYAAADARKLKYMGTKSQDN